MPSATILRARRSSAWRWRLMEGDLKGPALNAAIDKALHITPESRFGPEAAESEGFTDEIQKSNRVYDIIIEGGARLIPRLAM